MPQGKRTVTDDEMLKFMRESSDPAFTTRELADHFEMTTEGVRGRLTSLESTGAVFRKKPSPRTIIWWLPEDQEPAECSA